MTGHETESKIVDVAQKLMALAIRHAEIAHHGTPEHRAEVERLYQDARLNMTLNIGIAHGGEGVTAVRLDLTDPITGQSRERLFEITAVPIVGGVQ